MTTRRGARLLEYRIRHLPEAAWRIVRKRSGDRLDEGLRKLIELWADDVIDPLATNPITRDLARARNGGLNSAANLTPEQRSARARAAVEARWAKRPRIEYPDTDKDPE